MTSPTPRHQSERSQRIARRIGIAIIVIALLAIIGLFAALFMWLGASVASAAEYPAPTPDATATTVLIPADGPPAHVELGTDWVLVSAALFALALGAVSVYFGARQSMREAKAEQE